MRPLLRGFPLDTHGLGRLLTDLWQPQTEANDYWVGGHYFYHCDLSEDIGFYCTVDDRGTCILFDLARQDARGISGHIWFTGKRVICDASKDDGPFTQEEYREFAEKWLPTFRRVVWLCAFQIEHTAHEELEWSWWWKENVGEQKVACETTIFDEEDFDGC